MEQQTTIQKFLSELEFSENIPEAIADFSKKIDLVQFINSNLKNLTEKKFYYPSNSSFNNFFIGESNKFTLNISFFIASSKSGSELYSLDSDTYILPLQETPFKYKIYSQVETEPNVLNKELKLNLTTDKESKDRECIVIKRFSNVLELDNTTSFITLVVRSKETLDYVWQYNASTLKPEKIIASNTVINRLVTSIKIMAEIGNSQSHEIIESFCYNVHHSVRWEALKALININYDKGIFHLKRMTDDPHPEIKLAATNSLKKLNITL